MSHLEWGGTEATLWGSMEVNEAPVKRPAFARCSYKPEGLRQMREGDLLT